MDTIDFKNITKDDLKNPRMKRAYNKYIKELEKIAVEALLSLNKSK